MIVFGAALSIVTRKRAGAPFSSEPWTKGRSAYASTKSGIGYAAAGRNVIATPFMQ